MTAAPTAPADVDQECDLLRRLRETPGIFSDIRRDMVGGLGGNELKLQQQLRRRYPEDLVRAALIVEELRRKAIPKFSRADRMWFDRRGFEQSTAEPVARHKANRFAGRVYDLCCGIGGDSLALASRAEVIALDANPAACLRTAWNAEVYDVGSRVTTVCADVSSMLESPPVDLASSLIHIDPDRRAGSEGRVSRIEDYVPGLPVLHDLESSCQGGAIKVGPASNFGGKFPNAEIELISLNGECKEATVWFGSLAGLAPFRATVLPSGETIAGHPLEVAVPITPLGRYLYDPDPAIVRAGLLDVVAERLGLSRLDGAEEYLTSDTLVHSGFVQPFEVLAELSNNERELRGWLRKSNFGRVEIKCRHIPIQIETLRKKIELPGDQAGVILFARVGGKARVVMGCRVSVAAP